MFCDEIYSVICEHFGLAKGSVSASTVFSSDLHADSIDLMELIVAFEDRFDLSEIPETDLADLTTVGLLVDYMEKKVQKK